MQIFITTLIGKRIELSVDSTDFVWQIKQRICEVEHSIQPEEIILVYKGNLLNDAHSLSDCNIQHESSLQMVS